MRVDIEAKENEKAKKADTTDQPTEPEVTQKADTKKKTTETTSEKTTEKVASKSADESKDKKSDKDNGVATEKSTAKDSNKKTDTKPKEKSAEKVTEKATKTTPKKSEKKIEVETVETPKKSETSKKSTKKTSSDKPAVKKDTKTIKTIKVAVLDDDVKNEKPTKMKLPFFRRIHVKVSYLILGALVIVVGAFFAKVAIWEQIYLNAKEGQERPTPEVVGGASGVYETPEGEEVDETEPTEQQIQEYNVAPDKPRYLSIPSIRVYRSRVVEIGVRGNGELGTPTNIYDTGWYNGSSLPGTRGTSVMDAHGGSMGVGVFRNLPKLHAGDKISVEMGDGRIFTYRVVDTALKNLGDDANNYMSTAFSSPDGSTPSLTLITCTGDYWLSQKTYSKRFFVRAVLE